MWNDEEDPRDPFRGSPLARRIVWLLLVAFAALLLWLLFTWPVQAAQVHKCTALDGSVSFQDSACSAGDRAELIVPVVTVTTMRIGYADALLPDYCPPTWGAGHSRRWHWHQAERGRWRGHHWRGR